MSDQERLIAYVQSVYLTRYNRYIDDPSDEDGVIEVNKTIDFTNQFLDDFETEADWNFVRDNDVEIGTITGLSQSFDLPTDARKLIAHENRPLTITQDGTAVSQFDVVNPNQITKRRNSSVNDCVTVVNGTLIFSRPFKDYEMNGTIVADVINIIPRLASDDITLLDTFLPLKLLILGVAKEATLPDIVQGGLSPSFAQKYDDLLERTKAENNASSEADQTVYDDYSSIGGIY